MQTHVWALLSNAAGTCFAEPRLTFAKLSASLSCVPAGLGSQAGLWICSFRGTLGSAHTVFPSLPPCFVCVDWWALQVTTFLLHQSFLLHPRQHCLQGSSLSLRRLPYALTAALLPPPVPTPPPGQPVRKGYEGLTICSKL